MIALVGGGVWAWNFWFNQGAQPSEALPADTLAYVAVDMDPTGEQKAEFIEIARKFPFFEEEFGFDLDTKDDVKKWIFEKIQDEEDVCTDLDYDDDLKPWLGDRFAFAVVDRDQDEPAPVLVVQVTDEDQAVDGLEALMECFAGEGSTGEGELSGYAFLDDWVVLAETEEIAKDVVSSADESPLSEDEDFQELTDAAGDPGVLNAYVAPEGGSALLDEVGDDLLDDAAEWWGGEGGDEFAAEFEKMVEEFPGAAATLRFADGDLEFEAATGELNEETLRFTGAGGPGAGEVVSGLPDTTVGAMGWTFPEDWGQELLELVGPALAADFGASEEETIAQLEEWLGISIPEDVETLTGEALALAVDSSISMEVFEHETPELLPAGLRIKGDPEEIEEVLDKIRVRIGPDAARYLVSETDGDHVLIATNEDYVEELVEGGELGERDVFREVVDSPEEASVVYFIDFDADNWLVDMLDDEGEDEVAENLEPLSAFGLSTRLEDDNEMHVVVRLTTD